MWVKLPVNEILDIKLFVSNSTKINVSINSAANKQLMVVRLGNTVCANFMCQIKWPSSKYVKNPTELRVRKMHPLSKDHYVLHKNILRSQLVSVAQKL